PAAPTFTRGVPSMCDYSLHHVATRPAQIEDKLVTTKFSNSITRGFPAVDNNVEYEPSFGIGLLPNKKIGQWLARFRQINTNSAVVHHDALEFPDGQVVLLTRLIEGQRATVLQRPAAGHPVVTKEATRPAVNEPSLLA